MTAYNEGVLLDQVLAVITRHSMFAPGDRVGVAVSGGQDSVFLLHALKELAPRWNLQLSVLHVDHQLRGEASRADADFVRNLAASLGFPCIVELADPAADPGNLEQAARNARLAFFHRLISSGQLDKAATGHTQSDQAETVLHRLIRGSGPSGLSGVLPVTREGLVRPLLQVDRASIADWLQSRGLAWRNDETNLSRRFLRNRIRLDLLPLLREQHNPRVDANLAHTAEVLRDEDAFLHQQVLELAETAFQRGDAVVVESAILASAPKAIARRLVRLAIAEVRGDLRQIEFEHVEAILEMAAAGEGHARLMAPGVDVMRSFEWLRFAPPGLDAVAKRVQIAPLQVPGDTNMPDGRVVMRARLTDGRGYNVDQEQAETWAQLDWDRLTGPLQVRYWLPGDQYEPAGHGNPEKLKTMFQNSRIPLWERRFWPIVEDSQGIVWSRKFGPGARYQATPATRKVLEIAERDISRFARNQFSAGKRL